MKSLIGLVLLCVGCAGSQAVAIKPEAPPCPPVVVTPAKPCSDQIMLLDESALKQGASCPDNSRMTFPSSYFQSGKVLVLCQCK